MIQAEKNRHRDWVRLILLYFFEVSHALIWRLRHNHYALSQLVCPIPPTTCRWVDLQELDPFPNLPEIKTIIVRVVCLHLPSEAERLDCELFDFGSDFLERVENDLICVTMFLNSFRTNWAAP